MSTRGQFWLAKEVAEACRRYEAGEHVRDIAAALGRSERSVRKAIEKSDSRRPPGFVPTYAPKPNAAWPRVKSALEKRPMTRAEVMAETKLGKEPALRAIDEHHGKDIFICRWVYPNGWPVAVFALGKSEDAPKPPRVGYVRRPRPINPWVVVAGYVTPPATSNGRIVRHLHDEELEAA